jgi:hypothetical protein
VDEGGFREISLCEDLEGETFAHCFGGFIHGEPTGEESECLALRR